MSSNIFFIKTINKCLNLTLLIIYSSRFFLRLVFESVDCSSLNTWEKSVTIIVSTNDTGQWGPIQTPLQFPRIGRLWPQGAIRKAMLKNSMRSLGNLVFAALPLQGSPTRIMRIKKAFYLEFKASCCFSRKMSDTKVAWKVRKQWTNNFSFLWWFLS